MIELLAYGFVVVGVFLMITGSLGMLRFPDVYTRTHPAGVTDSLGAPCVIIGLMILHGVSLFSGKLLILIIFLLLTGPTSTHAVVKAAMLSGHKPKQKDKA